MQELIVTLIVTGAPLYAVWRLAPAGWRRGAARGLAGLAARGGASTDTTQKIEQRVGTTSGCGSCDRCQGCAGPSAKAPRP